jgi:ATP-dependent DNA helicase RecQ
MSTGIPEPLESHLAHFGLQAFRPGQREVIEAVLTGQDCLVIMPTGGGKSLCYQLPSIARSGTTLVVSPLIALMKDQVDALTARGLRATFINSSLGLEESRTRLAGMIAGEYDLVYIAPERLRNKSFQEAVAATQIQLLAVDEAHCISEWGHDFRPDYARLGQLRERLGNPQTIALTATATPLVRTDVMSLLRLREPQVFITGFARPNLHFEVRTLWSKAIKLKELVDFLDETPGAGIIYGATRKRCEEIAEELTALKLKRKVKAYHAGLDPDRRRRVQEEFMSGELPVIAATNAFGMGIDKADLRFVVHFDIPGSLEAYYQEAGRAGRDGDDSHCLLLFNERDRDLQEWFIENSYPPRETIEKVYNFLRKIDADPIQLTLQEVKEALGLDTSNEGVAACEKTLEKAGALERLDTRQNMASVRLSSDLPTLVDLLAPEAKTQRKVLRTLERIVGDARHDYVFFPPARLEAMAELDGAAIGRALRELQKLDVFDYVPPFRGRAIRMKLRDVPFAKLEIDFVELEHRKQAELDKVQQVVDFARSRRCRQLEILEYFGDPNKGKCGACDNCGGLEKRGTGDRGPGKGRESGARNGEQASAGAGGQAGGKPAHAVDAKLAEKAERVVRMALSGVARSNGRVGKGAVAGMLKGSGAKTIKKMGLDKLSTFGLLALWKTEEIETLLDVLLRFRLIEQGDDYGKLRPVVRISERGRAVMRGDETADILPHLNAAVHNRIQSMPAVVQKETPAAAPPEPAPAALVAASQRVSTDHSGTEYYWTWRLLADGYSLDECQQIRGLSPEAVLSHLLRAVEQGREVALTWGLAGEQIALLSSAIRGRNAVSARTLFEELHGAVTAEAIEFFLAATANQGL